MITVLAGVLAVGGSGPAAAEEEPLPPPGRDCLNHDWGEGGREKDTSTSNNIRGIRSNMYVAGEVYCNRISSIYIVSPLGGFYEFGYVIGYSNCPGHLNEFFQRPTLFYSSQRINEGKVCRVFEEQHPTAGNFPQFRASDINGNSVFGGYFNGDELVNSRRNMDFSQGQAWVGAERSHGNDGMYARWNDLDEYHDGNQWSPFNDLGQLGNVAVTDPAWKFTVLSNDTGRTELE